MKPMNALNKKSPLLLALIILLAFLFSLGAAAQGRGIKWATQGSSYYKIEKNEIVRYTLPENEAKVIVTSQQLTPQETTVPLKISYFTFSSDNQKVLLFTNTKRVWRLNSKGDYWVLNLPAGTLSRLGKDLPASSLMFAKFSPDGSSVAYVSGNNLYVENLATGNVSAMTTDGSVTRINGTFDWVYEEEFACRDGFRWSPDSRSIAYWQLDASGIRKFYMINNTDSIYSQMIPIEYPKVGENPSSCKIGVVTVSDAKTTWMSIPGDPVQHYIVRMEFIPGSGKLLVQQLNRKQNLSRLLVAEASTGNCSQIYEESDAAWVDIYQPGNPYTIDFTNKFTWITGENSILWDTEKDGWRHFYRVSLDGKPERIVTPGKYDVMDLKYTDVKGGYIYYMASPENATQKYLYRAKLNGKGDPELLSPVQENGSHEYSFSADGKYAYHTFSNHFTQTAREFITVDGHKPLTEKESILARLDTLQKKPTVEFFRITTKDGVEMDGWMVKPKDFDPKKKYPVVFTVYTEPAGTTVSDTWGIGQGRRTQETCRMTVISVFPLTTEALPHPREAPGVNPFTARSAR